jgi:hypothetical protein
VKSFFLTVFGMYSEIFFIKKKLIKYKNGKNQNKIIYGSKSKYFQTIKKIHAIKNGKIILIIFDQAEIIEL